MLMLMMRSMLSLILFMIVFIFLRCFFVLYLVATGVYRLRVSTINTSKTSNGMLVENLIYFPKRKNKSTP